MAARNLNVAARSPAEEYARRPLDLTFFNTDVTLFIVGKRRPGLVKDQTGSHVQVGEPESD